ncbi:hypothetical protein DAPPUDRAFT_279027 [Daphnia pulex]|uniref:Uncharacterized protein n=1 Tax=Daphnia pulex TaxID=6669 RepID=E9I764_DAPPU|nr:hypothetical protein DAPPUDRAFT_279027 [Daphnia pulex]|eukprot:EFX60167.1 hypothetical protein DAPPUDRAFT_279027 [Daphnia pulex]
MNAAGWNEDQIRQAHGLYEQLTGQRLSLHLERHRQWALLLAQGHTLDDLRRSSPTCNGRSAPPAATSAHSNSRTSFNWTASRKTSPSVASASIHPPKPTHPPDRPHPSHPSPKSRSNPPDNRHWKNFNASAPRWTDPQKSHHSHNIVRFNTSKIPIYQDNHFPIWADAEHHL